MTATEEKVVERLGVLHEKWCSDWAFFIESQLNIKTWSGMKAVIQSVHDNPRTSVRACHGISKTLTGAAIAVTFLNLYKPSIVITTAPTGRQVKELLWKEIRAIYQRNAAAASASLYVNRLLGDCQTLDVRVAPDRYMIGFSTDYSTNIEGFHSPNILWVLDEAKGLPQWVYDSIEGSMTGGFVRVLEISTTDGADQQCPLRRHHTAQRSKWNTISLSAWDSPFVDPGKAEADGETINPLLYDYGKPREGREWSLDLLASIQVATEQWIDDRREEWKDGRPDLWDTKVRGGFNERGESNVIPLAWVMSAVDAKVVEGGGRSWGLDIARMGGDRCVLTPKIGKRVERQTVWGQCDAMETVGKVVKTIGACGTINIDVCGIGGPVYDRLQEIKRANPMRLEAIDIIGIDSAKKSKDPEMYLNLRAELWFSARDLFERQYKEGNVLSIPDDPELIEDLTGIRYKVLSDGRHQIEKKEDFKTRFGRSPDKGDSFVYCIYERRPVMDEEDRAQMARRRLARG